MIAASRRSFITGFVALVAAPAIVRAGSLMPVNSGLVLGNTYLEMSQITREAVRLFQDSNGFLHNLPEYEPSVGGVERLDVLYGVKQLPDPAAIINGCQYDNLFAADGAKIGDVLRIRLPVDYVVGDGPAMTGLEIAEGVAYRYVKVRRTLEPVPQIPDSLALAAAAVAVAPVVLAKPVTRRFWGK